MKRGSLLRITLILSILPLPLLADNGDDGKQAPLRIPLTASTIKVDAELDESAWEKALLLDLKYETQPGENIPAPVRTEVLVIHDEINIYFGIRCYDPNPSAIRARYADRDDIWRDDLIYINLDTFNDGRRNYFFGVNAVGIQRDGIEATNYGDTSWDAIWDSAAQITDFGYVIEMAIPFSSIQFQRTNGTQTWGIDISRWYPRSYSHRCGLVPMDRNINSYQAQFMKIEGFEGIEPGKNIEITPTITAIKTDERESLPDGRFQAISETADAGVTLKWGVTSNFTLNGTVNPDFSQVEADARQLDINEPFALFYPEKRPFFIEGMDFFNSPVDAVYTRTLRDPIWGAKLTGKEGANTLGAYFVQDDLTNLLFPGSQGSQATSLQTSSYAGVLRYKRDFGTRYTFGSLITNRQSEDYYNRVGGVDGEVRFDDRNRIEFQFLGSSTQYPERIAAEFDQPEGEFDGTALEFTYRYQSRNLNISSGYVDYGAGFRADLGFVPQVDFSGYGVDANYQWINSDSWWSMFLIGSNFFRTEDHSGNLLSQENELVFAFNGALQSWLNITGRRSRESYQEIEYTLSSGSFFFQFNPIGDLRIGCGGILGDRIDYANTRKGDRIYLTANGAYNLGKNIYIDVSHDYEKMRADDMNLYTANITQTVIRYHFNSRTFFRSILQYVQYNRNADNYFFAIEPVYKDLFTQFIFSYKINPRTVLFLGYSDNHLGTRDFGITQANRTFFIKLGYAWQL